MKNTITQEDINTILDASKFESLKMGKKTTVVCCTLPNGFTICESSSCVDPVNYNHSLGEQICRERIANKVWELEGYVLQNSLMANK